jgi:hypothetical protein
MVRVVPAVAQVSPAAAGLAIGTGGQYTITLEAAAPVAMDVALSSASPAVVAVPASATVPMGATQVSFAATGMALGGPVAISAAMGGQAQSANARVLGLFLSEVHYNPAGTDTGLEWIELYNAAPVDIVVTGMKIDSATAATYTTSLTLAGTVPAGGCVVVGGPNTAAVSFFQAMDFAPDLGNVTTGADGINLVTAGGAIVDNVIYGGANSQMTTDENGAVPANADVGDAGGGSIERTAPGLAGPWAVQVTPSPGNCTPISS